MKHKAWCPYHWLLSIMNVIAFVVMAVILFLSKAIGSIHSRICGKKSDEPEHPEKHPWD